MFSMKRYTTLLDKCLTITVTSTFATNPVYIKCEQTVMHLQMMDLATPLRAFLMSIVCKGLLTPIKVQLISG